MSYYKIRKFEDKDAITVSNLIKKTVLEINIRDYKLEDMIEFAAAYDENKVLGIASTGHMYVAIKEDKIVGCGAIAPYEGRLDQSILLSIFTLPEYIGHGVGKEIMSALECDEYYLRAKKIVISASLSAGDFYYKLGYSYKNGIKKKEDGDFYWMEKVRG